VDYVWDTIVYTGFPKRALIFLESAMSINVGSSWLDKFWEIFTETWGKLGNCRGESYSSMFPMPFILSFNIAKSGRVVLIGWRNEKFVTGDSTEGFLVSPNCWFLCSFMLLSNDPNSFAISYVFPLLLLEYLFSGLTGEGVDLPPKMLEMVFELDLMNLL